MNINSIDTVAAPQSPVINRQAENLPASNRLKDILDKVPDAPSKPAKSKPEADEDTLKLKFHNAIKLRAQADAKLTDVFVEMIAEGIERDEAIEWGLELAAEGWITEEYVRSLVSSMYKEIDGGVNAKGQGRKQKNPDRAAAGWAWALKACDGDVEEATALCRTMTRMGEKILKADKVKAAGAKAKK